jgi:4-hydroxybenzoyl-CoA reductase subunit beta
MTYAVSPFTLHQPRTISDVLAILKDHPDALYLAGGTDLMVNMRRRIREPQHLIALKGVDELRGIRVEKDTLTVGALTTLTELSGHVDVAKHVPLLAEAAGLVAGPTIRNMATVGGNLVLDTRCRYYNQSYFWRKSNDFCLKKDGTVCHVAPGGSFCWAAFSADTPPVWMLLDAEMDLAGSEGLRTVKLRDFYGTDGRWSIATEPGGLKPGELILRVRAKLPEAGWEGVYEKLRVRDSIDYPLVGVAVMIRWGQGAQATARQVDGLKIALTAVNPRPEILAGTEAFEGQAMTPAVVEQLKKLANRLGKPMRTTVADPAYRRSMIGSLVEKAVSRLAPEIAERIKAQAQWA